MTLEEAQKQFFALAECFVREYEKTGSSTRRSPWARLLRLLYASGHFSRTQLENLCLDVLDLLHERRAHLKKNAKPPSFELRSSPTLGLDKLALLGAGRAYNAEGELLKVPTRTIRKMWTEALAEIRGLPPDETKGNV